MNEHVVLEEVRAFVKDAFSEDKTGHDFEHMHRVSKLSRELAEEAGSEPFLAEIIGLIHDVYDHKLTDDPRREQQRLATFLTGQGFDQQTITRMFNAIDAVSFSKGTHAATTLQKVVQDADRLDAIGAIGIIRTLTYGQAKGRPISETMQHFNDKLFKIKALLNTSYAKEIASSRDELMHAFYHAYEQETNV